MSVYKANPSSSVFTLCSDNPGVFMFQRCRWRWISRVEGENRVFTRLTFVSCCRGRRISQVACYRTRLICPQRKKRRVRQHSGAVLLALCRQFQVRCCRRRQMFGEEVACRQLLAHIRQSTAWICQNTSCKPKQKHSIHLSTPSICSWSFVPNLTRDANSSY